MPIVTRKDFYLNFAFRLEEGGFAVSGFNKISKIKVDNEIINYAEGGALVDYLTLGRAKVDDITLTRGLTENRDIFNWFQQATNTVADIGGGDEVKRTFDLVQTNRSKVVIARFRLHECLPRTFSYGEWDNSGNEIVMEELVLAVTAVEEITI